MSKINRTTKAKVQATQEHASDPLPEEAATDLQATAASPRATRPATGTATVTVALKHPNGIVLEAFDPHETHEPVMGGGTRKVTIYKANGQRFVLNGNRTKFGEAPKCPIIGDYALTQGVPVDLWNRWLEQHKDSPLVMNNLIFAYEKADMSEDAAVEGARLRSGMEPINASDDVRIPRRRDRESGKMVQAIEKANV